MSKSEKVEKLLKDKKYFLEKDRANFGSGHELKKSDIISSKALLEEKDRTIYKIEIQHIYDTVDKDQNRKETQRDNCGALFTYYVVLQKENNVWKVRDIISNDLTSGLMFDNVFSENYFENLEKSLTESKLERSAKQSSMVSFGKQ